MLKRYVGFFLGTIPMIVNGQGGTLDNANNTPPVGATFQVHLQNQYVAPGPGGEWQFWSFSGLQAGASVEYQVLDPSTYVPFYPEATHLITNGQDTLIYRIDNSGMQLLAEAVTFSLPILGEADIHAEYTDPVLKLVYPAAFTTTWSDPVSGSYDFDGTNVTRVGTITGNVDAHGTVELPSGPFNEILRVHTRTATSESATEASGTRRLNEHTYYAHWLKFPLLRLTLDSISITSPLPITNVIERVEWLDEVSVGIMEAYEQGEAFGVWPTPATGHVNVTIPGYSTSTTQAILRDVSGRTVRAYSIEPFGNSVLDINGLPAGQYLLQVIGGAQTLGIRKVIVQ